MPWIRRLASDYAFDYARLARFYAGDPAQPDAWADAIARRHRHPSAGAGIAGVIAAQQARREAPAESRAMAAHLADPRAVAIVTGQQAGLFGGPLFTLLKAITTLQLAKKISREHGVPVIPLFWIDAEDHDWPEVRTCTVLDAEGAARPISLSELTGAGEWPIGRLRLEDHGAAALESLREALPDTEFSSRLIQDLAQAYRPSRTMAEAFGCWMESVLGSYGLVVYDASDPAAKPLAAPVFERELASPGTTGQLAANAGDALIAAGYHRQVDPADDLIALFYLNGGRHGMRVTGGEVAVGGNTVPLTTMRAEAVSTPQHFSPNVLLRPVVQDTLFPTICYVAGPNELAYLGQLREVYGHFDVPMPLMYQRATATIADSAALRFLARYDVALEDLQAPGEARLNQLLDAQLPPTVEQALAGAARDVEQRMATVAAEVKQVDPTLEGTVQSTLSRMQHDLKTLHNKVIQAAKRRDETLRRQFTHAQRLAFPNGHAQEREVAFLWFLNRYGPALVDRLIDDIPPGMGHHWVLSI